MNEEMLFSHENEKKLQKVILCKDNKYRHRPSSFHMQDPESIFKDLNLKAGESFLDLGCGVGDYSLYAQKIIGSSGMIYAIDANEEAIELFNEEIAKQKIKNIFTQVADIKKPFIIAENSIDFCYIATVLHSPQNFQNSSDFFKEIKRVLKPHGRLGILEIKKEPTPFGPPMDMRISPEELVEIMKSHSFTNTNYSAFEYSYLAQFMY